MSVLYNVNGVKKKPEDFLKKKEKRSQKEVNENILNTFKAMKDGR